MTGKELKELRERIGWTVQHAAKQVNRTVTQWRNFEQGRTAIPKFFAFFMVTKAEGAPKPATPTPNHLKLFRSHFKLSQQTAANYVGVTRVTWNRWEQERSTIPVHMLFTLRGLVAHLKTQQGE